MFSEPRGQSLALLASLFDPITALTHSAMSSADIDPANSTEGLVLEGDPAPELVEGRIWVDGCFDFFHHGEYVYSH